MADGYGTWRMEHSAISHQPSAISHDGLPDTYGGEIADRRGEEALLVLVVRARARGVEGARRAVEVALQQQRGRDAERRPVRRGIALERAREERARGVEAPGDERDARGAREIVGVRILR